MVGAVRFELTTSCTRNKRASQATLRPDKLGARQCRLPTRIATMFFILGKRELTRSAPKALLPRVGGPVRVNASLGQKSVGVTRHAQRHESKNQTRSVGRAAALAVQRGEDRGQLTLGEVGHHRAPGCRRPPWPSYEPEPRPLVVARGGAGVVRRYSACSPSLKAMSVICRSRLA